jgi:glycerol-3-phosphate acyltransferase PlsY
MTAVILILFSYLLGSVPCAYIAGHRVKDVDVRTIGDRNAGAANVYRNIGHAAGIAVAAADVAKGAIPILVAQTLASQPVALLCGGAAVAGHNWPPFSNFKGGRGMATTIGVLFPLLPKEMSILLAACAVPFLKTRNLVVTGSILFAPLPLLAWALGASNALILYAVALPCLVGLTNILTTRHLSDEARREAMHMR